MSNESSSETKFILFYMLLQIIFEKSVIAGEVQKNGTLFGTRFSSPTALRRFWRYTNENDRVSSSDWDHLVDQFCFYNLLQNSDRLKDIFKKIRAFLTPNLRGKPLLLDIKRKVMDFKHFLFYKSSEIPYHFRDILRCNFGGRPHISLMGLFSKKMKSALC